jgi:hypothetical protein
MNNKLEKEAVIAQFHYPNIYMEEPRKTTKTLGQLIFRPGFEGFPLPCVVWKVHELT